MENLSIKRWERPDSFAAFCDDWFYSPKAFVFLGRNRDSDLLTLSNFECALKAIGGESDTVRVVREHHWACGWVEWIAIHESDCDALIVADEILEALADYPVLDDEHFGELEWNAAAADWERMGVAERIDLCNDAGVSIFAARRDDMPSDAYGTIVERLAY